MNITPLQKSVSFRGICGLALATAFLACPCGIAYGQNAQKIAKTFYGTVGGYPGLPPNPNSPIITGAFDGIDINEDNQLTKDEVSRIDVNIYLPETGTTYVFSYVKVHPEDAPPWFTYSLDAEDQFRCILNAPDVGGFELNLLGDDFGLYLAAPDSEGRTVYFYNAHYEFFTFSDVGTGVSYGWFEADILLGLHAGLIGNSGMADSLLTMLDAAGSADGNDNPQAATKIFEAFIHRVKAQSGKSIDPWMADLLIEDARTVIASLL